MPSPTKFVFYDRDKKRWPKIRKIINGLLTVATIIAVISLFSVFYTPYFHPQLLKKFGYQPRQIIDLISTQEEDIIRVDGHGPLVSLDFDKDRPSLVRPDFQKEKVAILTFDDGPDPIFTPKILEILKSEDVKAVFFVVGDHLFRHPNLAKEIIKDGHQIGAHTFSHPSEDIDLYTQQDRMSFEFDFPQKIIQAQTGYKTKLSRVPNWGTEQTISLNSLILATYALDRDYIVVSSTINSFDWKEKDKQKVISNSVNLDSSQIILMHDGGGDRSITIASLPEIIKRYRQAGYEFKTIDALLKEGETAMAPVAFFEKITSQVSYSLFWLKMNSPILLNTLFKISLATMAINILTIFALLFFQAIRAAKNRKDRKVFMPFVSVLVPAFNEEKTIAKTLLSLLNSHYSRLEIIVINNNSTDKTAPIVKLFKKKSRVRLITEKKQGKFFALNKGIRNAKGEILVTIDADTQVLPDTISKIIQPFSHPKVGAVAGNLKVGNILNPLTVFQAIEYIVGLNLDRRAYDVLTAVPVVPGALGAWRKKAVKKAGGYKGDTLTEDADLTVRIQRLGYRVVFEKKAVAYTEAPENIRAFLKQRLRWTLGILQVLYKHKSMYFKRRHGALGMIILPYLGLIELPLMLISPVVDLLALVFLFYFPVSVMVYFIGFLMLKYTLTIVAFILAKETRIWLLAFLPLARVFYQGIWYYILYRSVLTAIKGVYVPWRKLAHEGSVTI